MVGCVRYQQSVYLQDLCSSKAPYNRFLVWHLRKSYPFPSPLRKGWGRSWVGRWGFYVLGLTQNISTTSSPSFSLLLRGSLVRNFIIYFIPEHQLLWIWIRKYSLDFVKQFTDFYNQIDLVYSDMISCNILSNYLIN